MQQPTSQPTDSMQDICEPLLGKPEMRGKRERERRRNKERVKLHNDDDKEEKQDDVPVLFFSRGCQYPKPS